MDADVQKDLGWILSQLWPTLVVSLVIYGGGRTAEQIWRTVLPATKDLFDGKTKDVDSTLPLSFKLWYATSYAHPAVLGALVALVPMMPRPMWVTSQTMAVIWFALAGMGNGQVHLIVTGLTAQAQKIVGMLSTFVRKRLGLPSTPPDGPTP